MDRGQASGSSYGRRRSRSPPSPRRQSSTGRTRERSRSRDRHHGDYRHGSRRRSRSRDRGNVRDRSYSKDRGKRDRDNIPAADRGDRLGGDRDSRDNTKREKDREHRHRDSGPSVNSSSAAALIVGHLIENENQRRQMEMETQPSSELANHSKNVDDDEEIDESAMKDIEKFLNEESEDEEEKALRLIEESRKRREEILKKHQNSDVKSDFPMEAPSAPYGKITLPQSESIADFSQGTADIKPLGVVASANVMDSVMEQNEADDLEAERKAVAEEAMKNEPHGFDIFSASPSDQEMSKAGLLPKRTASSGFLRHSVLGEAGDIHVQSNYDDVDGYYKPTIGEVIGNRYRTQGVVGKGVFSTVLRCIDLSTEMEDIVAIKMIRNNDLMRKAAEKELFLLHLLSRNDPENKKHCVKLLGHLEYRNHTTFVFESMQMNLRDALKKFGKNVGINVTAIRMYGRQLFIALKYLADLQIVHADIKLDNILVSDDLKQVKLCDFGSAFRETDPDRDPTPYLVSRFYRAPEIILGLHYDKMVDMFSVGTCLYELFTGHVMFPGRTNNDMLRLMQVFKGRFPNRMLKSHLRSYETLGLDSHFDADLKFKQWGQDPITGKPVMRLVDILQPTKDLSHVLFASKAGADDRNRVAMLSDLIHKTIILDPSKRIDPLEAIKHPFFSAKDKPTTAAH